MENSFEAVKPAWVQKLKQVFGGPSQTAFGTAVFFERTADASEGAEANDLEQRAMAWYQFFCGDAWERFGADNWRANWQRVHVRSAASGSIVDELASSSLMRRSPRVRAARV